MMITSRTLSLLTAAALLVCGAGLPQRAWAAGNLSDASALSVVLLASAVGEASGGRDGASTASVVLAASGAMFVVKAVEASAKGTVYVLERVSDGARVSVEVLGRGVSGTSVAVGTTVTVSVIGAGMVLSALGQMIAFIPNELGRALLHNERVTP